MPWNNPLSTAKCKNKSSMVSAALVRCPAALLFRVRLFQFLELLCSNGNRKNGMRPQKFRKHFGIGSINILHVWWDMIFFTKLCDWSCRQSLIHPFFFSLPLFFSPSFFFFFSFVFSRSRRCNFSLQWSSWHWLSWNCAVRKSVTLLSSALSLQTLAPWLVAQKFTFAGRVSWMQMAWWERLLFLPFVLMSFWLHVFSTNVFIGINLCVINEYRSSASLVCSVFAFFSNHIH